MKIHDAKYIADFLIYMASQTPENDLTNMKIQKLLYYIQGTCLAHYGEPIFAQEIEKWQFGPVVPEVYHHLKGFGSAVIENTGDFDISELEENQLNAINIVNEYFGQFSAIKLMNLTHNETPWMTVEMNQVIPQPLIKDFFDTIVVKE